MYLPFGSNLPLSGAPYYSRINSNYSAGRVRNHYITAFNPGYALQASELNEIQEQFFLNLNLTQRMNYEWTKKEAGFTVPFWEGVIPYASNCIIISQPTPTPSSATEISFNVLIKNTWYLWTDSVSKMSFWVHTDFNELDSEGFYVKTFNVPFGQTRYIGLVGSSQTILCCEDASCDMERQQLRDNTQGDSNTYNTCGASRKKVSITDAEIKTTPTNTISFFPFLRVVGGQNAQDILNTQFFFMDQQQINFTQS